MPTPFSRNLLALAVISASVPAMAQEQSLDELVIIGDEASASALPGSAHVVSDEELDTMKYTDVHQVARQVPGVYFQEEDGYGLRPNIGIRGSGSGRSGKVTLMEDGVLMAPAPYAAPAAYYFPSFGRMSGVEVLKGPDLLRYGPQTVGGAINFRSTPIPQEASGNVTTEIAEDSSKRIHAWYGASREQVGFVVETHQQETDGFKDIRDSDRETGFDKQDFVAKLRLNSPLSADVYHQLDLKVDYSEELSNETYLGLTDEDFDADPNQRYFASERDNMDTKRNGYMARHLVELNNDVSLTTTAYRNEFERNWYKAAGLGSLIDDANAGDVTARAKLRGETNLEFDIKNNNREYVSQGLDFKADWNTELAGMSHGITFGTRYHEDEVDRFQPVDTYEQVVSNGRPTLAFQSSTLDTGISSSNNRIEEAEAWSSFIADRIDVNDRLTVTTLLRYEDIETTETRYSDQARTTVDRERNNDTSEWLPGVGATYDLDGGITLLGGVHRGMAPASPGSKDNVEPEISVNYELGARFSRGATRAELIGFYSDYSNTVENCSVATPCSNDATAGSFSQGESRVQGIEALIGHEFTLANGLSVPVEANWTFTDGEITETADDGSVLKGDNLTYLPEHVANLRAGLRQGDQWDVYANVGFVDSMCIDNTCERGDDNTFSETESLTVVDLSGSYALTSNARMFAKVANVFDDQKIVARSPDGARPNLPRTGYVGVSVDF
ncbi:Fe3+-dicitrate receptor [Marinobacter vulgaris]|uniref:Fe3+-dicitrate receptor n=1 Tax=Marinobacter vulgaris TaxID=1928331 RepID=A0A2V3ZQ46_9GAMM|nr:TonB-dependent receptor [Marinobacter vulgaris]PXX93482.1 Fe3+-dicitrate receptor [Marinobacter vulgaris]TSJ72504.1 TonB-dependent receptor [Marinobacter vulgaris]